MARYLPRKCPKCRYYFGIATSHPLQQSKELSITAFCDVCGCRLDGWRLILGDKRAPETLISRMRKALS